MSRMQIHHLNVFGNLIFKFFLTAANMKISINLVSKLRYKGVSTAKNIFDRYV